MCIILRVKGWRLSSIAPAMEGFWNHKSSQWLSNKCGCSIWNWTNQTCRYGPVCYFHCEVYICTVFLFLVWCNHWDEPEQFYRHCCELTDLSTCSYQRMCTHIAYLSDFYKMRIPGSEITTTHPLLFQGTSFDLLFFSFFQMRDFDQFSVHTTCPFCQQETDTHLKHRTGTATFKCFALLIVLTCGL